MLVNEPDIADLDGQAEEVPEEVESEESGTETIEEEGGWSINDVPPEYRDHVDKAIKPFHSRTTKAEQKASELVSKIEELEKQAGGNTTLQSDLERMREHASRLMSDDGYRESIRTRAGIRPPQKGEAPEGWDNPDAVQARSLLKNDLVSAIEKEYGFNMSDLPRLMQSAGTVDTMVRNNARTEIDATKETIAKEGLPWSDDILDSCIGVVGKHQRNGENISLREAYDKLYAPALEAARKKQASTDVTLKGKLPFKPGGKGGDKTLTGDAKLRSVIDGLNLPGSYED